MRELAAQNTVLHVVFCKGIPLRWFINFQFYPESWSTQNKYAEPVGKKKERRRRSAHCLAAGKVYGADFGLKKSMLQPEEAFQLVFMLFFKALELQAKIMRSWETKLH